MTANQRDRDAGFERTHFDKGSRRVISSDDAPGGSALTAAAPHVVFSGGATAGHLFPGLAVAEKLRGAAPETRITFAGSGREFERRHVRNANFEYLTLACRPLPNSAGHVWQFLKDHFAGARDARRFLRQEQVSLVVGLGGFASVPMARAAIRHKVPLVLLEQNAYPGRANRLLARKAQAVFLALPEAGAHLRTSAQLLITGNPLRAGFAELPPKPVDAATPQAGDGPPRRLLVMGGSGGSSQLNEIVPKALYKVRSLLDGWQIVHQSGQPQHADTETLYRKLEVTATVVPFVLNMPQVLRWSDLVISRAGGTTLAELAMAGVPAILIPWAKAASNHQRRNAEVYSKVGAALTLDATTSTGRLDDSLAELLVLPLGHSEIRQAMGAAMWRLARPNATAEIVLRLRELLATTSRAAA